jgi:hypothetical protein
MSTKCKTKMLNVNKVQASKLPKHHVRRIQELEKISW